ncbi:hypothetical protein ACJJTC_003812 [Scirpophaga incertulas]
MEDDIEQGREQYEMAPLLENENSVTETDRAANHSFSSITNHPRFFLLKQLSSPEVKSPNREWISSDGLLTLLDRRMMRLNTELLTAVSKREVDQVEKLIATGANPNATCQHELVSACHIAALVGGGTLSVLVRNGAERNRQDVLGRTPMHLAAWAGNVKDLAILLDLPEDMIGKIESNEPFAVEDATRIRQLVNNVVNIPCTPLANSIEEIPSKWKDNIDHGHYSVEIPSIEPGLPPLHVASSCSRKYCVWLLLAAGADPNISNQINLTALDMAGSAQLNQFSAVELAEVIRLIYDAGGRYNTMKPGGVDNVTTPLHRAVELTNIKAIKELLKIGASIDCLNLAGETPLHVSVRKKLQGPLKVLARGCKTNGEPFLAAVDVKDREGHTVLQAAIEAAWVPGVCVALEAGADVTLKANDGETPIHSAAALGNLEVLNEILSAAKQKDSIDYQNDGGETALFKAVANGFDNCVTAILDKGASIRITLRGDINVFHVAAKNGHFRIIEILLNHLKDDEEAYVMLNSLTESTAYAEGFAALHFAVKGNHLKCVQCLLDNNANIRQKTTLMPHNCFTPLHIAAENNYFEIAELLIKCDSTVIHDVDFSGRLPIHTACYNGSRNVIVVLLREGANLASRTEGKHSVRRTAIDMAMNNLSQSTEFMEEIFDSYIITNSIDIRHPDCTVVLDYRVFMPRDMFASPMNIIEALLETGNTYGQKRLLVHPLVESFIYFRWRELLPCFYTTIACHGLFVLSLSIFIISAFYYKDTSSEKPVFFDIYSWSIIVYFSISLVLLQEFIFKKMKGWRYLLQMETWVIFLSIILALILPVQISVSIDDIHWTRHPATVALLLAWVECLFLLSRFPKWGYYVLMFGKVASNVIKILTTFVFLLIGFALCFMIEFRSKPPFEGPWPSFIKTIVMMTSEFEYDDLSRKEQFVENDYSLLIFRLIFLTFLLLAAIVLMNLTVGMSVNDINNLEILGNIRRLEKQIDTLSSLNTVVYKKVFKKLLPKVLYDKIRNKRNLIREVVLRPGMPSWNVYTTLPSRIWDAIFEKTQNQNKQLEDKKGKADMKEALNEIHTAVMLNINKTQERLDNLHASLNEIKLTVLELGQRSCDRTNVSTTKLEKVFQELHAHHAKLK